MQAVVVGATGAIGREVVTALAASDKWEKVVACVRREVPTSEWVPAGEAEGEGKAAKIQVTVRV
jgi:NAD(P)-dependent dehydrogenase (short-subunit alcohol dehydrogenase family)